MSSKKANICCVKPPEPSFLTEIKKKVGYKEGPTLEDKVNSEILFVQVPFDYLVDLL